MMLRKISPAHPRAESLRVRECLVEGFEAGLVVPEGLAAHGRGEALDYILGERTVEQAKLAMEAAVAELLFARYPVISVNGNVAALTPREVVELARAANAKLEVNLFHGSVKRERAIAGWLRRHGASEVLGVGKRFATKIPEVHSDRRKVDRGGIAMADVVLVPLEDGDRTKALKKLGKRVIAVDLNPLSRTAQAADITIVDNITRALPLMVKIAGRFSRKPREELQRVRESFDNKRNLREVVGLMRERLGKLSGVSELRYGR